MTKLVWGTMIAVVLVAGARAQTPAGSEVNRRMENQQDRIAQGVKSGELTPRETAKLERQEARIHREVRRDRAANGGHLTPREKAKVNRQLNRESARIYRKKHDGAR